jgi:SAM-dependent methyltransferase
MNAKEIWEQIWASELEHPKLFAPSLFSKRIVSEELLPQGSSILSLGSGPGLDEVYFAEHGYQVTASDFSKNSVNHIQGLARKGGLSNLDAILLDLTQPFPFEDSSLDAVYAHMCLHYFSNQEMETLLKEISRVLRPGGFFLMLTRSVEDWKFTGASTSKKTSEEDTLQDSRGLKARFYSEASLSDLVKEPLSIRKIWLLDLECYNEPTSRVIELYAQKS